MARSPISPPAPASSTKHLQCLEHAIPGTDVILQLEQRSSEPRAVIRPGVGVDIGGVSVDSIEGHGHKEEKRLYHPTPNGISKTAASASVAGTGTTGSTLWLSAQVLSAYLSTVVFPFGSPLSTRSRSRPSASVPPQPSSSPSPSTYTSFSPLPSPSSLRPPRNSPSSSTSPPPLNSRGCIIDLGSGIGYLPITLSAIPALSHLTMIATDLAPVLPLLDRNIASNREVVDSHISRLTPRTTYSPSAQLPRNRAHLPASSLPHAAAAPTSANRIITTPLDWEQVASTNQLPPDLRRIIDLSGGGVKMIVTSDTIYAPHLLEPLFRTIILLSTYSSSPPSASAPSGSLCDVVTSAVASTFSTTNSTTNSTSNSNSNSTSTSTTTSNRKTPHEPISQSGPANPKSPTQPPPAPTIYLALESRDPGLCTKAILLAKSLGIELRRVGGRKVTRCVERVWGRGWRGSEMDGRAGRGHGGDGDWDGDWDGDRGENDRVPGDRQGDGDEDGDGDGHGEGEGEWDGVEIWTGRYRPLS